MDANRWNEVLEALATDAIVNVSYASVKTTAGLIYAELTTLRRRAEDAERRVGELERDRIAVGNELLTAGFDPADMPTAVVLMRAALSVTQSQLGASNAKVGELERAVEVLVNEVEHFRRFATPHQNEVLEHIMEETNQNPHAKAAIDAAGGEA